MEMREEVREGRMITIIIPSQFYYVAWKEASVIVGETIFFELLGSNNHERLLVHKNTLIQAAIQSI